MPPLRRTPNARRTLYYEADDDHGFNPAWARAPDPVEYARQTPQKQAPVFLPSPESVAVPPIPKAPGSFDVARPSTPAAPQQQKLVRSTKIDSDTGLDLVTYAAMAPFVAAWYLVNGANAVLQKGLTRTLALVGAVHGAPKSTRFNPLSRKKRPQKSSTSSRTSMLDLPPHMVGATPNVVRQARGDRRRQPGPRTPTADEARKWQLFHATPLPKPPKPAFSTPVLPTSARTDHAPTTPFVTPKFEFSTPQRKLKLGRAKEFAHNVHKSDFNTWLKFLHKHGIRTTTMRTELIRNFSFPTDAIMKMVHSPEDLTTLAKCFCHQGFLTHYRMQLPPVVYPEPTIFRSHQSNISLDSVTQQRDGCCRFCRGYSWAGQHEVRLLNPDGIVPQRSQHKSVKPYTREEQEQFAQHKFDMLFRRWCQESRYDWIFEEPRLDQDEHGRFTWRIPGDDPRLRHIAMMKQQHTVAMKAKKMYNEDLNQERNSLIELLSKQDLASKILLDYIRKENPEMAQKYYNLDLERKRRQVHTEWLCVKQVKVLTSEAPASPEEHHLKHPALDDLEAPPAKVPRTVGRSVRWAPTLETNAAPATGRKTPAKGILKPAGSRLNLLPTLPGDISSPLGARHRSKVFFDQMTGVTDSIAPTDTSNAAHAKGVSFGGQSFESDKSFFPIFPGFDPSRIRKYELSGHRDPSWDTDSQYSPVRNGVPILYGASAVNRNDPQITSFFHPQPSEASHGNANSLPQFGSFDKQLAPSSLSATSAQNRTNAIPSRDLIGELSVSAERVFSGAVWSGEDIAVIQEWLATVKRLYHGSPHQALHALSYAEKFLVWHRTHSSNQSLQQIHDAVSADICALQASVA